MRGASEVLAKRGFAVDELLPPQQAVIAFLARVAVRAGEQELIPIEAAAGRFLATDVHADRDYPAIARSAMDGFAVRSSDGAIELRVTGEVQMGALWQGEICAGQTVRIPTGGALPAGADAVIPREEVADRGTTIVPTIHAAPGDCLTQAGADMRAGEKMLLQGRRIGAAEIAVLATLGYATVPVYRRPRVAVLSSGDELVEVGAAPGPAQVRDSNRYAISASLRARGAEVIAVPNVPDVPGALQKALEHALPDCDAIVLTGGSSVGEKDLTPAAIAACGEPGVVVHGLRVKPGKPTVLGAVGTKPVIGLPGNPTSALIILEAVAGPIVAALTGSTQRPFAIQAIAAEPISGRAGWTHFVPVSLRDDGQGYHARPLPIRSSFASLPARADGFIILDENAAEIAPGMPVRVHPLTEGLS